MTASRPRLERSAELVRDAAERGARFLTTVDERPIFPREADLENLRALGGPLPETETDPAEVLQLLDEVGAPGTVSTIGGRYFGFVIGGALPASAGASALAAAWDQCAGMVAVSPVGAALEDAARTWVLDALRFDPGCAIGFVTGATMANLTGLAAARRKLLLARGWDVERQGLFGAPEFPVIVGEEVHVSVLKALGLLGLGRERVVRVPTDGEGRMRADAFPRLAEPSLVCLQAGNVNTGSFDPAEELCARARASGSWVHVDGAFGLWACASRERDRLTGGLANADSWSLDAHKWLNVPYDSGLAIVRDPAALEGALHAVASYLTGNEIVNPTDHTPEMSRRARGMEVWAALRSLGRAGVVDLVERCCSYAVRFAEGLTEAGHEVRNEVVLNQVMVSFGTDAETDAVIAGVQADGTCWCGGTTWHGRRAMRIAVSNWSTTEEDVEQSL